MNPPSENAYSAIDSRAAEFSPTSRWGISSSIDIYECDPVTIRDAARIRAFVKELCELIGMKR
ncbi:MAG: hypothetical protein KDK34_06575, partial [Leptospiraceae bacterium]|nr:hypothetical protein [Leptospiraceae bacterium]